MTKLNNNWLRRFSWQMTPEDKALDNIRSGKWCVHIGADKCNESHETKVKINNVFAGLMTPEERGLLKIKSRRKRLNLNYSDGEDD